MTSLRTVSVLLGTALVIAFSASPATALSTQNPQWHRCEKGASGPKFRDSACTESLASGEFGEVILESGTREFIAEASGVQKFTLGEWTISCKKLSAASGARVTGAPSEELSGAEATFDYEECEVAGFSKCEINKASAGKATITTNTLTAVMAYLTKEDAEKETGTVVAVVAPKELTEGKSVIASFELTGTCPLDTKLNLEGEAVLEDATGPHYALKLEANVLSPATTEAYENIGKKTTRKTILPLKTRLGPIEPIGKIAFLLPSPTLWSSEP